MFEPRRSGRWTVFAGVFCLAFVLGGVASAQHHGSRAKGEQPKKEHKNVGSLAATMHQDHMMAMAKLKQALAAAKKTADAGDAKGAAKLIATAQDILEKQHHKMHKAMKEGQKGKAGMSGMECPMCEKKPHTEKKPGAETGEVINELCPIMGGKINRKIVKPNLTRAFKGKMIGFCCGGCPAAWDALSDKKKEAKLQHMMK